MFQNIIKHFGYLTVDLFASRLCHQLPQYVEARSKLCSNRCNATVLKHIVFICFPPFQSEKSNSEKGLSRTGRTNNNSYTSMANTTLVSSSVRHVNTMPTAVDTTARSVGRSSRNQTPFSSKQETKVSGLEGYRISQPGGQGNYCKLQIGLEYVD